MDTNFIINENNDTINFEKRKNSFFELNQNNGNHYQFTLGLYNLFKPSTFYSTYNHFVKFDFDVNFHRLKEFSQKISLNQFIIKLSNYKVLRKHAKHNDLVLSSGLFDYVLMSIFPLRKNLIFCIHTEAKYFRKNSIYSWFMWIPLYLIIKYQSHHFLFINYFAYSMFKKKFPKASFYYIFHPYETIIKTDINSIDYKYFFADNDVLVVGAVNKLRFDKKCIEKLEKLKSMGFNLVLLGYIQDEIVFKNIQKYFVRFYLGNDFVIYSKIIGSSSRFFISQPDDFTASSTFLDVTAYSPSFSTIYTNDNAYIDEIIGSKRLPNLNFVKI